MSDRTCSIEGCAKPACKRGWCSGHHSRWLRHGDPLGGQPPRGGPAKFIEAAIASATDECIIWPFASSSHGYGQIRIGKRALGAHRLVLERTAGPPPQPGMYAAHAPLVCHTPACVNPRHLRWATMAENMADSVLDGTQSRGEDHPSAKLTAQQVLQVVDDPRPCTEIARQLGVGDETIRRIKTGQRWSWLTGIQP